MRRGRERPGSRPAVRPLWLFLAMAWAVILAIAAVSGREDPWLWRLFAELRFSGLSWRIARELIVMAIIEALVFVPLGIACSLAFRRRLALAGLGIALVLAFLVTGFSGVSGWHAAGLFEMSLPVVGCFIGFVLSGAFRHRPESWLPSLLLRTLAVALVATALLFWLSHGLLVSAPAPAPVAEITSEQKRELVEEFRRNNPLRVADNALAEINLDPDALDALLSWGALVVDPQAKAAVRAVDRGLMWRTSMLLPRGFGERRYLTVGGVTAFSLDGDRLDITRCELSVGSVSLSGWRCRGMLRSVHRWIFTTGSHGAFVAPIEHMQLDASGLSARYGRLGLDESLRDQLQQALGPGWEVRAAARAQFDLLREQGAAISADPEPFLAAMRLAFTLAQERSKFTGAAEENQGAILALATIFGHPSVATMAGVERPADWREIRSAVWPVRMHGRSDWTQHFTVSAAITQVSMAAVSDAAGLLKEELDAAGRSGFSFSDLLADRAGTVFGEAASRDDASARRIQAFAVAATSIDQFMPHGADLPEGISDAELTEQYGGVGGARYQAVIAEIESRVSALPAAR